MPYGSGHFPSSWQTSFVACREGYRYEENDNAIFNVFNRRSGAIAAAISSRAELIRRFAAGEPVVA